MRNASFMDGRRNGSAQQLMHSHSTHIAAPTPNTSFLLQIPSQTSGKSQKYPSRSYHQTVSKHIQNTRTNAPAKMGIKSGMTVEVSQCIYNANVFSMCFVGPQTIDTTAHAKPTASHCFSLFDKHNCEKRIGRSAYERNVRTGTQTTHKSSTCNSNEYSIKTNEFEIC